jgi:hypothetical protein
MDWMNRHLNRCNSGIRQLVPMVESHVAFAMSACAGKRFYNPYPMTVTTITVWRWNINNRPAMTHATYGLPRHNAERVFP